MVLFRKRTQTNMMLIIKGSTGSTKGCGYKTKSSLAQQSLVVVLRSIGARLTQTFQAEVMAETLKFGLLYRTPTRGKLDPAGADPTRRVRPRSLSGKTLASANRTWRRNPTQICASPMCRPLHHLGKTTKHQPIVTNRLINYQ